MDDYQSARLPVILVADDSATISAMVSSRFARSGYDVVSAANGEDALRLARERLPALAILDVEMPRLNGLEVTAALREDEATKDIPVILLTAHDLDSDVARGFASGATDYVTKPFSPQELEARVETLLGRR
jgi:DNA-binding response OmpR family regulator